MEENAQTATTTSANAIQTASGNVQTGANTVQTGADAANTNTVQTTATAAKTYTDEDIVRIVNDLNQKHETKTKEVVEEALKKAKMSSDALAEYEKAQKENALNEREQSLARRELSAETVKLLAEKQLSTEILDLVLADNKENTLKRIDAFKAVFDKALQDEVVKRIAGKTPSAGSGASSSSNSTGGFLKTIWDNQAKRN